VKKAQKTEKQLARQQNATKKGKQKNHRGKHKKKHNKPTQALTVAPAQTDGGGGVPASVKGALKLAKLKKEMEEEEEGGEASESTEADADAQEDGEF